MRGFSWPRLQNSILRADFLFIGDPGMWHHAAPSLNKSRGKQAPAHGDRRVTIPTQGGEPFIYEWLVSGILTLSSETLATDREKRLLHGPRVESEDGCIFSRHLLLLLKRSHVQFKTLHAWVWEMPPRKWNCFCPHFWPISKGDRFSPLPFHGFANLGFCK